MYQPEKTAQASAVLLSKAKDHELGRLKLMKLLYLSDRQAFGELGATISGDRLFSMRNGPILSATLDVLQGSAPAYAPSFDAWVKSGRGWMHELAPDADLEALGLLSDAEVDILERTWAQFGHMSDVELAEWTHDPSNCPEWTHPGMSSKRITWEQLARALGFSDEEVEVILEEQREHEAIQEALATL